MEHTDEKLLASLQAEWNKSNAHQHDGGPRSISDVVPEVLEKYQLKSLPTTYGGINYRSRLEARWAVFFDALRIPFDYEPEGFDLGGLWYLPDFWLPKQQCYIEIKGNEPNDDACEKASRLAVSSGFDVFVFFGGFTDIARGYDPPNAHEFSSCQGEATADYGFFWCECPRCGMFGICYGGRSDRLPCKSRFIPGGCQVSKHGDKGYSFLSPNLVAAYKAARSMRFTR